MTPYNPYYTTFAPMSASPIASDGSGLTPQGWGWLADIAKAVVPIVLNQLSTTPGGMAPMSAGPAFSPMSAGPGFAPMSANGQLTPQGWGWITDIIKTTVPIILNQLSTTPGAMAPMSAGPGFAPMSAGGQLTPQGWGWLADVVKAVVPVVLNQLSTTPGGMAPMSAGPGFSPMSAGPGFAPMSAGGQLTPQGWGWLADVVKAVVPVVLNQLSATPGGMAPMSAGPALSPYGGFMFSGPTVNTPWGGFQAGGIGFQW